MSRRTRLLGRARGFTLVELLVASAVLSLVATLIYGAFSGLQRSKDGVTRVDDRYREGRIALRRLAVDFESAYLSNHAPIDQSLWVVKTAFIASSSSPADRVSFNAFVNRRLDEDSHQSDQAEISYFGSDDPEHSGVVDLVRRIDPYPDLDPEHGGRVEVLATDIDLFDLEYLDPLTGLWQERWDTTQGVTGQPDRLPLQVKITLVLNGGWRSAQGQARDTIEFVTKVSPQIRDALRFAVR